jgi:putative ABC transport system permease protein
VTLVGLAAKNILRNKFRTILTILGVAVATLTFVFLRTVFTSWKSGAEYSAKDRVIVRNRTTMNLHIPLRYADEVRAMPHVKAVTHSTWFGGRDPKHEKEFFSVFGVDTKTFFDAVVDDQVLPAEQKTAWLQDRRGIIAGDIIARKLGWKVGDTVTLETGLYPAKPGEPWTFTVSGIYTPKSRSVDRNTMYFHWDYLNDYLPPNRQNMCNYLTALLDSAGSAADASRAIDAHFADSEIATMTQDERSFRTAFLASLSAILGGLNMITVAITIIMLLILGNTIAMGVRERTSEYGVLRALGFLPRHVALFIVGEAMLTGLLGGLLGLMLAVPMITFGMGPQIEENMGGIFPSFKVDPLVVVSAIGLALLLGAFAAAIPAFRASRLKIVDALRRVA